MITALLQLLAGSIFLIFVWIIGPMLGAWFWRQWV